MFSVWIDADSCPRRVREYVFRYTQKNTVPLMLVANREIPLPPHSEQHVTDTAQKDDVPPSKTVQMILCEQAAQAADDYIFTHCTPQDIVITRDIPFAARLVEKKICAMNDRGTVFTKENIGERLSERNFMLNLAEIGLGDGKKSTYGKKEFDAFSRCFDAVFQQKLMNARYEKR